jgi:DNA polymerase IV
MSATRRILHVDVDAMFVQCAVLADPDRLAGESLILVGGSPEGRGVVTSASYGCRAYGVRSAMPMATALRMCPRAIVVPVPGAVVRRKSRELAEALRAWTPVAVMASVDEAYLDLTGTEALYRGELLDATARRIQDDVRERCGLTVSIGGASNRLVAKLATGFAKPAGVFVVAEGGESAFVGRLEIQDLIGIGPAFLESLRARGIASMSALRALDEETMAGWWGADRARWLWCRCRGIDESPVTEERVARSVSSETTFRRDIADAQELERQLLTQVVDASGSLRKQGLFARTVTVKLRDSAFTDRSRSRTVRDPIQTDRIIFDVARELLRDLLGSRGGRYRLIGIGLTSLTADPIGEQGVLDGITSPLEAERDRVLASAIDRIRARHGGMIGPASLVEKANGRE